MKSGWRKLRQRIFRRSAYLRAASFPLPLGNGRTGIEMIKLTGVTKSFGALDVLKGIDLELHRGDSMVLIGGSGSGKSLLLKSMIGLVRPDSGTVEIDGQDVRRMRGRSGTRSTTASVCCSSTAVSSMACRSGRISPSNSCWRVKFPSAMHVRWRPISCRS